MLLRFLPKRSEDDLDVPMRAATDGNSAVPEELQVPERNDLGVHLFAEPPPYMSACMYIWVYIYIYIDIRYDMIWDIYIYI